MITTVRDDYNVRMITMVRDDKHISTLKKIMKLTDEISPCAKSRWHWENQQIKEEEESSSRVESLVESLVFYAVDDSVFSDH